MLRKINDLCLLLIIRDITNLFRDIVMDHLLFADEPIRTMEFWKLSVLQYSSQTTTDLTI